MEPSCGTYICQLVSVSYPPPNDKIQFMQQQEWKPAVPVITSNCTMIDWLRIYRQKSHERDHRFLKRKSLCRCIYKHIKHVNKLQSKMTKTPKNGRTDDGGFQFLYWGLSVFCLSFIITNAEQRNLWKQQQLNDWVVQFLKNKTIKTNVKYRRIVEFLLQMRFW